MGGPPGQIMSCLDTPSDISESESLWLESSAKLASSPPLLSRAWTATCTCAGEGHSSPKSQGGLAIPPTLSTCLPFSPLPPCPCPPSPE